MNYKRIAAWIGVVAVVVWVIWNTHFPIADYYLDDDWFVLPERLWFQSSWDWFKHLLFFSQNRLTWVGDYMLYRPGLFAWIWFQDVAFREHRFAQQFLLIAVSLFTYASFLPMLGRENGKLLAVAAALYATTGAFGGLLFTWPHINGYLFAVGLYTFAAHRLASIDERSVWGTATLLFIAATFHEFVSVTLAFLIGLEFVIWRKRDREGSKKRLLAIGAPLAAYLLMVVVARTILDPPSDFATEGALPLKFDEEYFTRVAMNQLVILIQLVHMVVPFAQISEGIDIARFSVGALAVVALIFVWLRRRETRWNYKIALCFAPIVVFFTSLFVTKVAALKVMKAHYYPMYLFFFLLFALLVLAPYLGRRMRASLIVVMLASSLWGAYKNSTKHENVGISRVIDRTVSEILDQLRDDPELCFAGLVDPERRRPLANAAGIALQLRNCEWHAGRKTYFVVQSDGGVAPANFEPPQEGTRIDFGSDLLGAGSGNELAPILIPASYNVFEARQRAVHDGIISGREVRDECDVDDISLRLQANELWPIMYNTGFYVSSGSARLYFILRNNAFSVAFFDGEKPVKEVMGSSVFAMKDEFELRVRRAENRCFVFIDGMLILESPLCWSGSARIGVFDFKNGTEPERIVEFSGSKTQVAK